MKRNNSYKSSQVEQKNKYCVLFSVELENIYTKVANMA